MDNLDRCSSMTVYSGFDSIRLSPDTGISSGDCVVYTIDQLSAQFGSVVHQTQAIGDIGCKIPASELFSRVYRWVRRLVTPRFNVCTREAVVLSCWMWLGTRLVRTYTGCV